MSSTFPKTSAIGDKKEPGPRITPHTFRRSCTSEMIKSNANPYHVKELLGHKSFDTLNHYDRLDITDLRKRHARCHPREKDDG